ncbi:YdbC family protein [Halobacillus kuroshimensis]|uniref:YdbC family protein n=1 Tax=Halobacillus kuroshimensis TaxID=302481 RepID=UPI0004110E67|nr:YdbC family protein [Halobacillus kuroshimensis]
MLIKLMKCKVSPEKKEAFSEAQASWSLLREIPGFLGQAGGWSKKHPDRAFIIAFWEDRHFYDAFMKDSHDEVLHQSGQERTYERLDVQLYESLYNITGTSPADVLEKAAFLRLAFTQVKKDKLDSFLTIQENVWNPGMAASPGMTGGFFAGHTESKSCYLILSSWAEEVYHRQYQSDVFPKLLTNAKPGNLVVTLTGDGCVLEENWRVTPVLMGRHS